MDLEKHIAAGTRREQDVVLFEQAGIVGDEVFAFGGLQSEASAVGARPQAQVVEVEFAVVVEDDPVLERGRDLRALCQARAAQHGVHIPERPHSYAQAEGDLQAGVARAAFLERDLVVAHRHENLGQAHIFLRVEIEDEVGVGEHDIVHEHALAVVEPREAARLERASLHDEAACAEVFHDHQIAEAVGVEPLAGLEAGHHHIGVLLVAEAHHLEWRGSGAVDRGVRLLVGIQLVNDVDRLRGHAEPRHEGVIRDHRLVFQPGPGDEIVKLHAEQDFSLVAQLAGKFLGHLVEVLPLVQSAPEEVAQFGIHRLRIVVAQEAQAGVDLLLHQFAIHTRKCREHLDECR